MIGATNSHSKSKSSKVEQYYRFHSRIYDATRWSFLFGRRAVINKIPRLPSQPRILEVGCGTGKNIELLECHYPEASILGIDLSKEMITIAQNKLNDSPRVELRQKKYGLNSLKEKPFDLILLSYSLTMMGNSLENILKQISCDLNPSGQIAVVDFHTSSHRWFRQWMDINHVDLSGKLFPLLQNYFNPVDSEVHSAYWGLWSYFLFLGKQR